MVRVRPKLKNKIDIPVNIYQGMELLKECPSIQEAARFFKSHTKAERYNWSAINNGIWYDKPFSINSATYYFTTDPEAVKNKLEKLAQKNEK